MTTEEMTQNAYNAIKDKIAKVAKEKNLYKNMGEKMGRMSLTNENVMAFKTKEIESRIASSQTSFSKTIYAVKEENQVLFNQKQN